MPGIDGHWNGQQWRASPNDQRLRSVYEERYGKKFILADMTVQDYGISYEELEPHFDFFEKVAGVAGMAGNLRGFCEGFGCFMYSKASPQTTILPILRGRSNLELRHNAYVTRIVLDDSRQLASERVQDVRIYFRPRA